MTGSAFRAVAPVSAICAAFRTQPSAYPPNTRKPDVAPTCGSVRQSYSTEAGAPAGGFRRRNEPQAAKQEKTLALFCAGLTTSARSAGRFEGRKRRFSAGVKSGLALIFRESRNCAAVAGTILALFFFWGG